MPQPCQHSLHTLVPPASPEVQIAWIKVQLLSPPMDSHREKVSSLGSRDLAGGLAGGMQLATLAAAKKGEN